VKKNKFYTYELIDPINNKILEFNNEFDYFNVEIEHISRYSSARNSLL
jgi:hypothetical protein